MMHYCKLDFKDLGSNSHGWDGRLLLPYMPEDALLEEMECLPGVRRIEAFATQAVGFTAQVRFKLERGVTHGDLHDVLFRCLSEAAGTAGVVLDFKDQ